MSNPLRTINTSFTAADQKSGVLVLNGRAGVLRPSGQTLTVQATSAGFDGIVVLERSRFGREAWVPLLVITGDLSQTIVQSRSHFDQEYRLRCVEYNAGQLDTVLSDVDDIQRELPKPDKSNYLIIKDTGIELPEGDNLYLKGESNIFKDGSPFEPYGIARDGGFLRFLAGGELSGFIPSGVPMRIDTDAGSFIEINDSGRITVQAGDGTRVRIRAASGAASIEAQADGAVAISGQGGNQINLNADGDLVVTAGAGLNMLLNGAALNQISVNADGSVVAGNAFGSFTIAADGAITSINASGAVISIGVDGNIFASSAAGEGITLSSNGGSISVDDDGVTFIAAPGGASILVDDNGEITLNGSAGTVVLDQATGNIRLSTASGTFALGPDGEIIVNSDPGTAGQVIASAGAGFPAEYVDATANPDLLRYTEVRYFTDFNDSSYKTVSGSGNNGGGVFEATPNAWRLFAESVSNTLLTMHVNLDSSFGPAGVAFSDARDIGTALAYLSEDSFGYGGGPFDGTYELHFRFTPDILQAFANAGTGRFMVGMTDFLEWTGDLSGDGAAAFRPVEAGAVMEFDAGSGAGLTIKAFSRSAGTDTAGSSVTLTDSLDYNFRLTYVVTSQLINSVVLAYTDDGGQTFTDVSQRTGLSLGFANNPSFGFYNAKRGSDGDGWFRAVIDWFGLRFIPDTARTGNTPS